MYSLLMFWSDFYKGLKTPTPSYDNSLFHYEFILRVNTHTRKTNTSLTPIEKLIDLEFIFIFFKREVEFLNGVLLEAEMFWRHQRQHGNDNLLCTVLVVCLGVMLLNILLYSAF